MIKYLLKSDNPNAIFNLSVLVLFDNFYYILLLLNIILSILLIFDFWPINAGKLYNNLNL